MRKFEVCVRGSNFLIETEEGKMKKSFFAARYAEAKDMSDAVGVVMDKFRAELKGKVLNGEDDPPNMKVVENNEIYFFEDSIEIGDFIFTPDGYVWVDDDTTASEMITANTPRDR